MSSKHSPFVPPKIGFYKWLQTTRKAEHRRRARLGLEKLKPIIRSNQDEELPKLPFPFLVDDKVIFQISPEYKSGFADRFRQKVIVTRVVRRV